MPLPNRRKDESRKDFVSRCVSVLTDKGEGKNAAQRVAICNTRAMNLTDTEKEAVAKLVIGGTAKIQYTTYVAGHKHSVPLYLRPGATSETSHDHGHSHKYSVEKDGSIVIKEFNGHLHEVEYED